MQPSQGPFLPSACSCKTETGALKHPISPSLFALLHVGQKLQPTADRCFNLHLSPCTICRTVDLTNQRRVSRPGELPISDLRFLLLRAM
jgi:hypothetical protein